jgi:DNA-binding HxlR family transcriptional regulator
MSTRDSGRRNAKPIVLPVCGDASNPPILATLKLLSRRWILRVLWELRDGSCGFREMQERCGSLSPDTLSKRLSELLEAGIAERNAEGSWVLTDLGIALRPTLMALNEWSKAWADRVAEREPLE